MKWRAGTRGEPSKVWGFAQGSDVGGGESVVGQVVCAPVRTPGGCWERCAGGEARKWPVMSAQCDGGCRWSAFVK